MCRCGYDASTPFCECEGCEWPDDEDDGDIAVTEFLQSARYCALSGGMTFKEYLDLCVEFDPANPDDDDGDGPEGIPDGQEEGADEL